MKPGWIYSQLFVFDFIRWWSKALSKHKVLQFSSMHFLQFFHKGKHRPLTFRSGLFVAGRLSNLLDIWLKEDSAGISQCLPQNPSVAPSIGVLRRWISSLIQMITHRDLQVTYGGLDCLHTVFASCRRLPNSAAIIEQIATDDSLVEKFLSLLVPQEQAWRNLESFYGANNNPSRLPI